MLRIRLSKNTKVKFDAGELRESKQDHEKLECPEPTVVGEPKESSRVKVQMRAREASSRVDAGEQT